MGITDLAGDIITAASALAGFILVFVGSLANSFESYDKTEQSTVRHAYSKRAWFALWGFLVALASSILAFAAKETESAAITYLSITLLMFSYVWVAIVAYLSVKDIK